MGKHFNLKKWLSELPDGSFQIILVHDIGDEQTTQFINQILDETADPRIEYREGKFGAPGIARNFGMTSIKSEWFWFVDADDLPELKNVLIELHDVDINTEVIVGRFVTVTSLENTRGDKDSNSTSLIGLARNPGIWRMIFKTKEFESYRFEEFRMAEDQIFLMDINFFERNIIFSDEIFYRYYKNQQGQLTSQKSAISDLAKTIPIVISKIREANADNQKFLEIMLARQIGSQFKSASWQERVRDWRLNKVLMKGLSLASKYRTLKELLRIILIKLMRVKNE